MPTKECVIDAEMEVVNRMVVELNSLSESARSRVVEYLGDRYIESQIIFNHKPVSIPAQAYGDMANLWKGATK